MSVELRSLIGTRIVRTKQMPGVGSPMILIFDDESVELLQRLDCFSKEKMVSPSNVLVSQLFFGTPGDLTTAHEGQILDRRR